MTDTISQAQIDTALAAWFSPELDRSGFNVRMKAALAAAIAAPQPEPQPVKQAPIKSFKELEYKIGWQRYEKVRKLNVHQFSELFQRGLKGERFDDMVDGLEAKQ